MGSVHQVMKVVENCGRKWSPKIPPPPELKKTSFAGVMSSDGDLKCIVCYFMYKYDGP